MRRKVLGVVALLCAWGSEAGYELSENARAPGIPARIDKRTHLASIITKRSPGVRGEREGEGNAVDPDVTVKPHKGSNATDTPEAEESTHGNLRLDPTWLYVGVSLLLAVVSFCAALVIVGIWCVHKRLEARRAAEGAGRDLGEDEDAAAAASRTMPLEKTEISSEAVSSP
mmetsp:Transcript_35034/g.68168  ORF Transcript_35034/g.68168 Transcript_35034/m.68168 type:complete len:171 (-) Transcript_35034:285-797(-)